MNLRKLGFSIIILLTLFLSKLEATHNMAGEIIFTRISGYTYYVKVITYTVESSPADRDFIELMWGDGVLDTLDRSNGPIGGDGYYQGEIIGLDVKMNTYEGTHTYPGPGQYFIGFEDANRNPDIMNIPNSVETPFYVQSMVIIDPFQGANSSPELLNSPLDEACVGQVFVHNPGAWDVDGDSLAYELISCSGTDGLPINGYSIPSSVTINETTGDLIWDAPSQIGEYNYAINIKEYRNGQLIGNVVRDMQVRVNDCDNSPPIITAPTELCVEAGDTIQFDVNATDSDLGEFITLSSNGGVYQLGNESATFDDGIGFQSVSGEFQWITSCDLVRNQYYQVLFKAEDNGSPVSLTSMVTTLIKIVAPAPENLTVNPIGNNIQLSWSPDECSNATCYKIYRGSYFGFNPANCETGVPAYTGYELIGTTSGYLETTFLDTDPSLAHGIEYCYMVVACFDDGAESYASEEVCTELKKDVPIITNVSIEETSIDEGKVFIGWSKPTEIDTVEIPGPYRYNLYRNISGQPQSLVYTSDDLNDTTFVDSLLDTESMSVSYYIEFINETVGEEFIIGNSQLATSIYLTITSADQQLTLSWTDQTPWSNEYYKIYEQIGENYFLIDSTVNQLYVIDSLTNLETYCYRIQSVGGYTADGIIDPILNYSQITCGIPIDTVAPCAPNLDIDHSCSNYYNLITWDLDTFECASDLDYYNLYYKASEQDSFQLLETYQIGDVLVFNHNNLSSVAGCYYVTAIDTFGNESSLEESYCFDNCPEYHLPNVFTPNADGFNDLLIPFPYQYIDHVKFRLFNRWGEMVFDHEGSPDIEWNGFVQGTNKLASDGVYYYVCEVYELRFEGIVQRNLTGYVHLIQGDGQNQNVGE